MAIRHVRVANRSMMRIMQGDTGMLPGVGSDRPGRDSPG